MADELERVRDGMVQAGGSPLPVFSGEQMTVALTAYKHLQTSIDQAMPDQIMDLAGKKFRKKGYWRAVAVAFGLTVENVSEERVVSGQFQDGHENFGFLVTKRATAPNGRMIMGDGTCFAVEKAARFRCPHPEKEGSTRTLHFPQNTCPSFDPNFQWKSLSGDATEHNVRAHAHTRAFNRAVSDLVGFGEVSAEEVDASEHAQSAGSGSTVAAAAAKPAPAGNGAEKPAANPDGSALVKSVTKPSGDKKPWRVELVDGRSGTTFDTKLTEAAEEARVKGMPIVATFEDVTKNGRTFTNLIKVEVIKASEAPLPLEDTEPKGEPEKILVVRKVPLTGGGHYHVIQSERRQYVTMDDAVAAMAEALRAAAAGPIPLAKALVTFDVKLNAKKVPYNEIIRFEEASAPLEPVAAFDPQPLDLPVEAAAAK